MRSKTSFRDTSLLEEESLMGTTLFWGHLSSGENLLWEQLSSGENLLQGHNCLLGTPPFRGNLPTGDTFIFGTPFFQRHLLSTVTQTNDCPTSRSKFKSS